MSKCNFCKIILMITMFLFLIIAGGCDDESGGGGGNGGGGGSGGNGGGGGGGTPIISPTNPMLSSLHLSIGELTPVFNPKTTQYTVSVSNSVAFIIVTLATASEDATISVNGANVANGSASGAINLNVGSNVITIIVANSSGQTIYKVTTIRSQQAIYQKITVEKARDMMMEKPGYIILDVRSVAEHNNKRIPDSLLIPHNEIESRATTELLKKDQLIFVYSQTDARSEMATRALVELGYTNVYDMGDINDWIYETIGIP